MIVSRHPLSEDILRDIRSVPPAVAGGWSRNQHRWTTRYRRWYWQKQL